MAYVHEHFARPTLPFKSRGLAFSAEMLEDFKKIVMEKAELYEQTYFAFMRCNGFGGGVL